VQAEYKSKLCGRRRSEERQTAPKSWYQVVECNSAWLIGWEWGQVTGCGGWKVIYLEPRKMLRSRWRISEEVLCCMGLVHNDDNDDDDWLWWWRRQLVTLYVCDVSFIYFDMDMSYTRVLHIKVAYGVPHKWRHAFYVTWPLLCARITCYVTVITHGRCYARITCYVTVIM
jgi:hypothetical protein